MKYSKSAGGFYRTGATNIPSDAKEVSDKDYAALMAAQARGCTIRPDKDGYPVAIEPAPPTADEVIKAQISALEASITDRRIREAVLGTDNGWLADVDAQIVTLRGQLTL